jgi:hypothetical protein
MARASTQQVGASDAGDNAGSAQDSVVVPADEGAFRKYLKDNEVEEFDSEILDFQARMSRGVAESVVLPVFQQLSARIQRLESQEQTRVGDSFWDLVEAHYPGARAINNTDPLWSEFLNGTDELSGRPLRDIGEAAVSAGDVGRIVSLLQQYAGKSAPSAAASGDGGGEERSSASAPRPSDEGNGTATPPVKPSRAKGETRDIKSKAKPNIRESDVKKFFDDVARGRYAGRQDEMKAREAAIEDAVLEGRVVPG